MSGARVSGAGQRQAGWGQAGLGQVSQGQAMLGGEGGKSKRRVTSKDSLFHYHHPNFYDFFPRAIAPFTVTRPYTRLHQSSGRCSAVMKLTVGLLVQPSVLCPYLGTKKIPSTLWHQATDGEVYNFIRPCLFTISFLCFSSVSLLFVYLVFHRMGDKRLESAEFCRKTLRSVKLIEITNYVQ